MGDERIIYSEDEDTELREAIEQGRRYKMAAEVFEEFLSHRQAEIMREFEEKYVDYDTVHSKLAELRVIRKYRDMSAKMISLGEIAEERMSERDG